MSLGFLNSLTEREKKRKDLVESQSNTTEIKTSSDVKSSKTKPIDGDVSIVKPSKIKSSEVNLSEPKQLEEIETFNELDSTSDLIGATNFIKRKEISSAIGQFFIAHMLKKIKDTELFKPKYTNFLDYIKNELDYKKSKAYSLIKIADTYPIESTSKEIIEMGIYKLGLLTNIHHNDLIEFIKENNIMQLSVRNTEKLVKENRKNNRSLPFENNVFKFNDEVVEDFQKRISNITENIYKLKSKPGDELKQNLYNELSNAKKDIQKLLAMINISENT